MSTIVFHYLNLKSIPLQNKRKLKEFLITLVEQEKRSLGRLSYVFCDEEYILSVNRSFLQHDYYTDIITFDQSTGDFVSGEMYISVETVKSNAKKYKEPYRRELLRVIFHGLLHLCGYNDKTKRETSIMRQKEEHYLELYAKYSL